MAFRNLQVCILNRIIYNLTIVNSSFSSFRMRDMDKDYTDDEIQEVMNVVDLTGSGDICFEEFCKVFIANIKTSASI